MKQCQADCAAIFSNLKKQEKQLKRKRRWLMGLPLSDLEKDKVFQYRLLPESLLREDDIFYETVKIYVGEAFGAHDKREDNILKENKQMFDGLNLKRLLLSCLNALTNKGLFLLAMILTRGSINFEKTRPKMKKVIKQSIPQVVGDQNNTVQVEILQHLLELLEDPKNVRENCLTLLISKFRYRQLSAVRILDSLHELSTDTLHAMLRKLRGIPARVPILQQQKDGETKRKLILEIINTSENMLSELVRGDELQAPLAKALAIAGLSLKRMPGFSSFIFEDFNQFSPEIKNLQDEISKAICLLKKVKTHEVRTFKLLLDPDNNFPGTQRKAAVKMLTEYLFECNDLDTIPKSLLNALAFINRDRQRMWRVCKKKEVEEEVECILNVSAEMKQIVLDFLPDHEFSEDFTDAYMEELEESDDGDGDDDYHDQCSNFSGSGDHDAHGHILRPRSNLGCRSYSIGLENLEESCGEHVPVDSIPSVSTPKGSWCSSPLIKRERDVNGTLDVGSTSESVIERINENGIFHQIPSRGMSISMKGNHPVQGTTVHAGNSLEGGFKGVKFMSSERSSCTNPYLFTQDVCDDVSMVAYNIIGHMLEKFAREDGLALHQNDSSYLRGGRSSSQKNEGVKQNSCKKNGSGAIVVQVVEELVPAFPKSGMEKLKALLDIV